MAVRVAPAPPAPLDPDAPIYLGDPGGISAYADQQTDAANTYLLRLGDAVAGLSPPVVTPEFPSGGSAPALEVPAAPSVSYPVWTSPAIPTAFTETLSVGDLEVEPFDADPPAIIYGDAPALFDEALPSAPTLNLAFTDPTLSVSLPAPPNLLAISVTPFDGLAMPTFSATEPTLSIVEPTIRNYTPGDDYTSALLSALQASLETRIEDGGTGLGADAENALWERGREREAKARADAIRELERMERLGMAMPPGIYLEARTRITTESAQAERGHSREVMIESARLELDNVKHALTTATQLEGQLIDYANAVEQRLFESTRYATEAGIAIYNAKVEQYRSLVQVYQTKVNIYEAQVRAEIARVDAYRATIEAERAKAEVNTALVRQYEVRVQAALSSIEIYKAEIAGIQAKADIERTKIMVFGEEVRAYAAQVNAYTAGVEGYRARLEGEKTKAAVYTAQVEAFSARVGASTRQIEGRVAAFRGLIEAKALEWDGYKAKASAESERVRGFAAIIASQAQIYQSTVAGTSAFNDALTKQWQATLDQNQRVSEIAVAAARVNAESYISVRSLALDAAKVGATVSSQLGAAALNAINWSTSIATSNSTSNSFGTSLSQSWNDSNSFNENHNYSFSV